MKKNVDRELAKLRNLIINLNEVAVLQAVADLLTQGVEPRDIMFCFQESLKEIGEMYQRGEYYMAGLILSGEIMRQSMRLLMPRLVKDRSRQGKAGVIILGTIEGDIHDLGKNMAAYFLEAHSFEVIDLGVDVPPRVFLKEILQREPDAVGVSLLMSHCLEPLKRLVHLVKETYHGRQAPPIFVGSGFLSSNTDDTRLMGLKNKDIEMLGVDYVVGDPFDTLNLCLKLTEHKKRG